MCVKVHLNLWGNALNKLKYVRMETISIHYRLLWNISGLKLNTRTLVLFFFQFIWKIMTKSFNLQGILEWVMDTMKKGNKEVQERILLLQKEKDQVRNWGKEESFFLYDCVKTIKRNKKKI